MKKKLILTVLATGCILGAFWLENCIWISQVCAESNNSACEAKAPNSKRDFFLSMNSCKEALKEKSTDYLCASGFNKDEPDATIMSSYRLVYSSKTNDITNREVPYSFKFTYFIFGLIIFASVISFAFSKLKKNKS
ncbi:MAG: hypothetical protein ACXWQQ_01495 [Pseudobdellovibrio sp.]